MFNRLAWLICLLAVLSISGCKPKEAVLKPMGDSAPSFGSGSNATLDKFLVGTWCVVTDEGPDANRYYDFKADNTFVCGVNNKEWTSKGKWTLNGNNVALEYQTMKDKSFQDYQAEYKKDEEGGGQVAIQRALYYDNLYQELQNMATIWVDDDQKHLTFTQPQPEQGQPSSDDLGNLAQALTKAKMRLERTEAKTE